MNPQRDSARNLFEPWPIWWWVAIEAAFVGAAGLVLFAYAVGWYLAEITK